MVPNVREETYRLKEKRKARGKRRREQGKRGSGWIEVQQLGPVQLIASGSVSHQG
jgi:hypothetical protein